MKKTIVFILFIVLGILSRIIPHLPNFSPLGAISLFGGFYLSRKQSFALPLVIMFVTDIFLGYHQTMLFVYLSYLAMVYLGQQIKNNRFKDVATFSVASSSVFFIVTNFGVWLMTGMYEHTIFGLSLCFVRAVPFFGMTFLSDLFFCSLFFGLERLISAYYGEKVSYNLTQTRI